jgi:hypothetical protein
MEAPLLLVGFVLLCCLNMAHQKPYINTEQKYALSWVLQRLGFGPFTLRRRWQQTLSSIQKLNASVRYSKERGKSEPHFEKDADGPTRRWALLTGGGGPLARVPPIMRSMRGQKA